MQEPGEIASGTENAIKIKYVPETLLRRCIGRLSMSHLIAGEASQREELKGFGWDQVSSCAIEIRPDCC